MRFLIVAILVGTLLPGVAPAAGLGRAAARGAARGATKRLPWAKIRRLDKANHLKARPKPLPTDRTARRYTTWEHARQESQKGLPPNTHMTPAVRGRPLAAGTAQRRLGLRQKPEVVESIRLPKGQRVRQNPIAGARAAGPEWTSPEKVPPQSIRKLTPLR
jgi:hypothetical protein